MFFLTNALTFVVGWSWVVLSRDLSTLAAATLAHSLEGGRTTRSILDAVATFGFGPLLGLLLVRIDVSLPECRCSFTGSELVRWPCAGLLAPRGL